MRRLTVLRDNPVVVLLLAGFLAGRIVVFFRQPVYLSPDTPSYRGEPGLLSVSDVLSFTGHSARLWGTPLFFAAFPDDRWRTFGEWTVATLAWGLLAIALCRLLRSRTARIVAVAAVLVLPLLPEVSNWDAAILSESLSVSLGVASLALLLWFLGGGGRPVLLALTVVCFWWIFIRPELRVLAGFVIVALIGRLTLRRDHRWPVLAATLALIAAAAWVTVLTPVMDRTFAARAWNGLSLTEGTFTYRLRFQVLPDPEVYAVYQNDLHMPRCLPAEAVVARRKAWAMTAFIQAYLKCPDLVAWGHRNAGSSGFRFAEASPGLYFNRAARVLPLSLSGHTTRGTAVLPARIEHVAFPSRSLVVLAVGGGWLVAFLLAIVGGALRRQRLLVAASAVIMVAAALSLLIESMYAAGDFPRFGIQEAVLGRVAVVLMVVAALDAAITRPRRSRAATSEADSQTGTDNEAETDSKTGTDSEAEAPA